MRGQAVERCCRHLGITKRRLPLAKCQVCCDDDRGALVEPADQVEEELTSRMRERQIAEFIEDDKVEAREVIGPLFDLACGCVFPFPVD